MLTKKVQVNGDIRIEEEWVVGNLNYYLIEYAMYPNSTQTVIIQDTNTFEMYEPSQGSESAPASDNSIVMGSPFWCLLNAIFQQPPSRIRVDVFVTQDTHNESSHPSTFGKAAAPSSIPVGGGS